MKSESVGHHEATQALALSVPGVMAIMLIASLILRRTAACRDHRGRKRRALRAG
jgi:hypothetical protein